MNDTGGSGMTMYIKTLCLACGITTLLAGVAQAQTIATVSHAGLRVTLGQDTRHGPSYSLEIADEEGSAVPMRAEAFTLPAPPRVVVDIPGRRCPQARREPLVHPFFAAVRFGVNPGKTRVVIDAPGVTEPLRIVKIASAAGSVTVHFAVGTSDTRPAVPEPPAEGEKREAKRASGVEVATTGMGGVSVTPRPGGEKSTGGSAASTEANDHTEGAAPDPSEESGTSAAKAPAKVTSISFDWLNDHKTPALVVAARGLDKYSFGEGRSHSYVLVIENARAANAHAIQTKLAPRDFGGFKAITARREGDDIVIKIYVEKGTKLQPARGSGKLLVRAMQ